MVSALDVAVDGGRTIRVHDSGPTDGPILLWHHGSPQTGALLDPLLAATSARGLRLVSYARPGYGGSTPRPGRDVASAAADVAQVMDALRIERFAVMGASGGGPHALACAARLPSRVTAAVALAGLAPLTDAFDWFAGMTAPGGLLAATHGRAERETYAATEEFDEDCFIAADWVALQDRWASLAADAGRAGEAGPGGLIDDDVAFAHPWGFELADVQCPVLVIQGGRDRVVPPSHAHWLVEQLRDAEFWLRPRDGHISVLDSSPVAMDWLQAGRS
jgi:pimeloyl-ACP methyl ester carboxylesterase